MYIRLRIPCLRVGDSPSIGCTLGSVDMETVLRRGTGCGHEFDWNTMKPLRNGRPGQPANDKQILFMDANDPRRQKTHISIEDAAQLGFIDVTE